MKKDALNINLFGGPCTGKSTSAAGIFYELKKLNQNAEYVPEFAKELLYAEDYTKLSDQLYVLAEQHHRIFRLHGNVDFIIHDSPFLLSAVYIDENPYYSVQEFKKFVINLFNSYNTLNFFLTRDDQPYQDFGRTQTFEEALEIDKQILTLLNENGMNYIPVSSKNAVREVLTYLRTNILKG